MRSLPALLSVLSAVSCAACGEGEGAPDSGLFYRDASTTPPPRDGGTTSAGMILIDRVYDGDTVRVRASSTIRTPDGMPMNDQHVRLLGVDAPEVAHPEANPPRPDPECFGDQAAAFANDLMAAKIVEIEFDPQHTLRDDFGRLLGYVRLPDDRIANEVMIRQGQAKSFRAFRHRDIDEYNALEQDAKDENLGLWASCPR